MIDTVILRHAYRYPMPKKLLQKFIWRGYRYSHWDGANDYSPRFFCYPSINGYFYLTLEVSLSRLLHGYNVPILSTSEIILALEKISSIASKTFELPFDAFTGQVGRIDYCYNFKVNSADIYSYLEAATKANPPYLKRKILGRIETVEFFNLQRKIYLYNKEKQMKNLFSKGKTTKGAVNAASGIIRLESRFGNPVTIQRLLVEKLGLPDRTAHTLIDLTLAKRILKEALSQFGLHNPVATYDEHIEKLRAFCRTPSQFQRLLGFLEMSKMYGQDDLVRLGFIKRSAFYNSISELRKADALIYTNRRLSLAPLSVR